MYTCTGRPRVVVLMHRSQIVTFKATVTHLQHYETAIWDSTAKAAIQQTGKVNN